MCPPPGCRPNAKHDPSGSKSPLIVGDERLCGALSRREQPPEPEQITFENWRRDLLQVPFCPPLGPVSDFFLGLLHRLGCPFRAFWRPNTGTGQHFATRPLVLKRPRRNARSKNSFNGTLALALAVQVNLGSERQGSTARGPACIPPPIPAAHL